MLALSSCGEGFTGMAVQEWSGQMNEENTKPVAAKKRATPRKKTNNQSAAKIRQAASKIKKHDCELIVESLVENAKTGKIQSIKLLYDFAHSAEEVDEREDALHAPSIAIGLASAPQWYGEGLEEECNEKDEIRPGP